MWRKFLISNGKKSKVKKLKKYSKNKIEDISNEGSMINRYFSNDELLFSERPGTKLIWFNHLKKINRNDLILAYFNIPFSRYIKNYDIYNKWLINYLDDEKHPFSRIKDIKNHNINNEINIDNLYFKFNKKI